MNHKHLTALAGLVAVVSTGVVLTAGASPASAAFCQTCKPGGGGGGGGGVSAPPVYSLGYGASVAVPTNLLSPTEIDVHDASGANSSFKATSLSTVVANGLLPGQTDRTSLDRYWVGAYVRVYNTTPGTTITVTEPYPIND